MFQEYMNTQYWIEEANFDWLALNQILAKECKMQNFRFYEFKVGDKVKSLEHEDLGSGEIMEKGPYNEGWWIVKFKDKNHLFHEFGLGLEK